VRELTPFGIFPPPVGQTFFAPPAIQQLPVALAPQAPLPPVAQGAAPEDRSRWITAGIGLTLLVGGALWLAFKAREDRLADEQGFYVMLYDDDAGPGSQPRMFRGPFDSREDAEDAADDFRDNWTTIIEWSDSAPSI
jgi:hypothetical protein